MLKKNKNKAIVLLMITILFCSLSVNKSFAVYQQFQAIKELEEAEKQASPEAITAPERQYRAGNLRNPFQGYLKKEKEEIIWLKEEEHIATPPVLNIQGIVWGGAVPQAIINNKVVKIGDTIEGASILEINKDGVVIFFEGREYPIASPAGGNLQNLEQFKVK